MVNKIIRIQRSFFGIFMSFTAAAVLLFMPVQVADSAFYHDLTKNRQPCSDCHMLHYSEGGTTPTKTPEGYANIVGTSGPYASLLVKSTTNELCLFCHDGASPYKSPDVQGTTVDMTGTGDEYTGAGYFIAVGTDNTKGHNLGGTAIKPPFSTSGMPTMILTCASCHEPHGTEYYRNLLKYPYASGTGTDVWVASDVTSTVDVYWTTSPPDPPHADNVKGAYKESNMGYKASTSKWCTECHDVLKDTVAASSRPSGVAHHLVDVPVNLRDNSDPPKTDSSIWTGGTGSGFGTATEDSTAGIPRLRFQVATASNVSTAQTVSSTNQVICTTCHAAHGWKYASGLLWPTSDDGAVCTQDNNPDCSIGCRQCHSESQLQ